MKLAMKMPLVWAWAWSGARAVASTSVDAKPRSGRLMAIHVESGASFLNRTITANDNYGWAGGKAWSGYKAKGRAGKRN